MPKFSIIVPIYNIEKYIEKCIDSVLAQSFSDFELILVDDGSTDRCPQICDEYAKKDARVKVIHKKNGGPSEARNAGLEIATGEYCWFVDGDDCISKEALESLSFFSDEKADIIKIGLVSYKENEKAGFEKVEIEKKAVKGLTHKEICKMMNKACTERQLPFAWRYVFRTDFLREQKIVFNNKLSYGEDSIFNIQALLLAEKVFFVDICIYGYCDRTDSLSKIQEKRFNNNTIRSIELYDKIRDESYEKYCRYPDDAYYADAGEFIIRNTYVYAILNRLYCSTSRNNFFMFRKVSCSEMIRKAFRRFDLNKLKSKSLEWYMFWFVKHRMYLPAFIIYRFFIF